MKKFILYSSLYLLPLLIPAIIAEIFLRQIPNDYSYKKKYLDAHADEIQTLILGNSHTYYGIDPIYFSDNTFNGAHVSQSLDYDFEILKKYNDKFDNLQTVIVPISFSTLWAQLSNGKEAWRIKNYILYYDIKHENDPLKFHFEIFSNSFITNLRVIKLHMQDKSISSSQLGWETTYNSENAKDLDETGETAAIRHTINDIYSPEKQKFLGENVSYLDSIIQICQNHNAKVIFVTPPAYKTYREHLNEEQLNIMLKTVNKITNDYSNCTYINLLADSTFVSTDYYDADHLSEIGAEKLSLLINRYIEESEK